MRELLDNFDGIGLVLANAILGVNLLFFALNNWGRLTKLSRTILLMAILGSVSTVLSYVL